MSGKQTSERPLPERRTFSIEEAAAMLGISRASAFQYAKAGKLPVIRLGGHKSRLLVPRAALERMLAGA
jgi:excisionase family DNA binding protein